jgi:WD40 repeat protein
MNTLGENDKPVTRKRRSGLSSFQICLLICLILCSGFACALSSAGDIQKTALPSPSPSLFIMSGQATRDGTATPQTPNVGTLEPFVSPQQESATDFIWLPGGNEVLFTTINEIHALSLSPSGAPSDLMPRTGYMSAENPSLLSVARDKAIVSWANDERLISVWQAGPNTQETTLDESDSPVTGLALSAQGDFLAYSAYDQKLVVWDVDDHQKLDAWQAPSWLANLSYSPDNHLIGGADLANFIVYIFDTETGKIERTLQWLEDASPALYGVFFSPDWRYLAWTAKNSVQIMDLDSGELGPQLMHEDFISAVAWSPDGRSLAVGAAGTVEGAFMPEIVIWDVQSGQPVITRGVQAPIESLSFSPDGSQLGILDSSGQFQVWTVSK